MQNIISWFEIPVANYEKGIEFYSNVLELEIETFDFNGVRHGIFKPFAEPPNRITGAVVESPDTPLNKRGPILFFTANSDMGAMLLRVEEFGGEIIMPKTLIKNIVSDGKAVIPKTLIDNNVGYYAYFHDFERNKMGLFSNS